MLQWLTHYYIRDIETQTSIENYTLTIEHTERVTQHMYNKLYNKVCSMDVDKTLHHTDINLVHNINDVYELRVETGLVSKSEAVSILFQIRSHGNKEIITRDINMFSILKNELHSELRQRIRCSFIANELLEKTWNCPLKLIQRGDVEIEKWNHK